MVDEFSFFDGFSPMFSIPFMVIGLTFLILGIVGLKNKNKRRKNCTSKTNGKVINIVRKQYISDKSDKTFTLGLVNSYPVFEYNIGDLKFVKEYEYGSSICKYKVGQNVEIYYNPENYNEYDVSDNNTGTILWIIFIVIGAFVMIMGLLTFLFLSFISFFFKAVL